MRDLLKKFERQFYDAVKKLKDFFLLEEVEVTVRNVKGQEIYTYKKVSDKSSKA